jgi:hypothetical protein
MTNDLLTMWDDGELEMPTGAHRVRLVRQIARLYGVSPWVVGEGVEGVGMPPSRVCNAAYHQRQRNRVKRRR